MPHTAKLPQDYRIILQQDAPEPLIAQFGPVTPEGIFNASIKPLVGNPIDVYASDANHGGGVHYDSKVAERCLSRVTHLRSGTALQMRSGLERLIEQGTDPLRVYCQGAHENGIDYMVRLRMNDLHDMLGFHLKLDKPSRPPKLNAAEPYYYTSQWRREHPELLLGDPHDQTPIGTYEYWERGAPNYALGQVRQYMLAIAQELVSNYDLDVLELDFIRAPFFFARAERYAQRHVMTEVVRLIAHHCKEAGRRRGRPLRLSARIADTLELSLRVGLDVQQWLSDGLLDMVTIGGGYNPFGTPWHDIVAATKRAGVPALACLNHGKFAKDRQRIRAAAHRAFSHGVNGFELWNFFYCMDYYHPPGGNPLDLSFTKQIADPVPLRDLAKTYDASVSFDESNWAMVGAVYDHVTWPGQLPLGIGCSTDGVGHVVEFDIPDEPARGRAAPWSLDLDFVDLAPSDRITFEWNGRAIEPRAGAWKGRVTSDRPHMEFSLPLECCRRGINRLTLKLLERAEALDPFITLAAASVHVPEMKQ